MAFASMRDVEDRLAPLVMQKLRKSATIEPELLSMNNLLTKLNSEIDLTKSIHLREDLLLQRDEIKSKISELEKNSLLSSMEEEILDQLQARKEELEEEKPILSR